LSLSALFGFRGMKILFLLFETIADKRRQRCPPVSGNLPNAAAITAHAAFALTFGVDPLQHDTRHEVEQ